MCPFNFNMMCLSFAMFRASLRTMSKLETILEEPCLEYNWREDWYESHWGQWIDIDL